MTLNEQIDKALKPLEITVSVIEHPVDGTSDRFCVIVPENDNFECCGDDAPISGTENAELALYCRGDYLAFRDEVLKLLVGSGLTVTGGRYLEYEKDTEYHHYIFEVVDVRNYEEVL